MKILILLLFLFSSVAGAACVELSVTGVTSLDGRAFASTMQGLVSGMGVHYKHSWDPDTDILTVTLMGSNLTAAKAAVVSALTASYSTPVESARARPKDCIASCIQTHTLRNRAALRSCVDLCGSSSCAGQRREDVRAMNRFLRQRGFQNFRDFRDKISR